MGVVLWTVVLGLSCSMPPDSVLARLEALSRALVTGPLRVAPDYPEIPAPQPRLHLAGCSEGRVFLADLAYRVIYILDRTGHLKRRFFIRSDHTPPFSMLEVGPYWVMVAYRHDPAIREAANWGTWIQVYDTAGIFLHSLLPVPEDIQKLGWRDGFQVYAVPAGPNKVLAVFDIGDCVYEITLPKGPVKPVSCGLQKRLRIPKADPEKPYYPKDGSPRVEGWVAHKGGWSLVVLEASGKRDTVVVGRSAP